MSRAWTCGRLQDENQHADAVTAEFAHSSASEPADTGVPWCKGLHHESRLGGRRLMHRRARLRLSASSDVAVGIELLKTAARGAGLNVDTNLAAVKDAEYVKRISQEQRDLEQAVEDLLPSGS